tara:strand:- start:478 stop:834 length:357 start_codon:yes stop_codon:yes gene_type:complete
MGKLNLDDWDESWVENIILLLLVIGFFIAILSFNSFLSYLSIFLAGALAGRIYYIKKHKEPILPFVLLILGFLLGYLIGGFWISRVWSFIFFGIGFSLSYYLHRKKILVIFKNEDFIK